MHKLSPSMQNKWEDTRSNTRLSTMNRATGQIENMFCGGAPTCWMLHSTNHKTLSVSQRHNKKRILRRRLAFHAISNNGHTWPIKASFQKASRRNQQSWPSSHFAKTSLSSRHSPHRPWISKDPASDNQHHASKIIQQTNEPLLIVCPPLNIKAGRCVLTWEPLALVNTFAIS